MSALHDTMLTQEINLDRLAFFCVLQEKTRGVHQVMSKLGRVISSRTEEL